jgi:hypothetical protein
VTSRNRRVQPGRVGAVGGHCPQDAASGPVGDPSDVSRPYRPEVPLYPLRPRHRLGNRTGTTPPGALEAAGRMVALPVEPATLRGTVPPVGPLGRRACRTAREGASLFRPCFALVPCPLRRGLSGRVRPPMRQAFVLTRIGAARDTGRGGTPPPPVHPQGGRAEAPGVGQSPNFPGHFLTRPLSAGQSVTRRST